MTYKEALEYLENEKQSDYFFEEEGCQEAVDLSIVALEKQIPKKPTIRIFQTYDDGTIAKCPVCGNHVAASYCGSCGQRIDWGDEK